MPDSIVYLSSILGSPLLDSAGERLGRVEDVIARLDGAEPLPPIIGLKGRIGGRDAFVPVVRVETLDAAGARMSTTKVDLAQFERRPGELLLRGDILDRSLINVAAARLVTARDVELVRRDERWLLSGIDTALRARLQRMLPRNLRHADDGEHHEVVSWHDLEAFVGHVPTSRLKLAGRRLGRLHPAQIADLVEAASHEEGEEILAAVGQDKELEADVFEELDDEHQVEFLRDRSDEQAAAVLARMATDDAADLLLEIDQERRLPILNLLPPAKQRKIKAVLGYNPSTAGGIMNPDFVGTGTDATVSAALERVRASDLTQQQISTICVVGDDGTLAGTLSLADLVRSQPDERLCNLVEDTPTPTVGTETDLPEVARLMTDYNLIAMPVLDGDGRPVGIIAVDDILELLLPEDWRRRAGVARS